MPRKPKAVGRIAAVRAERGLTQHELADRAGLSLRTLQRLERLEVANPPVRHLIACAEALNVPLSDVLEPSWLASTTRL